VDAQVVTQLETAGFEPSQPSSFINVPVAVESVGGKPTPVGSDVVLVREGKAVHLTLKSVPELFVGTRIPPSFAKGPTEQYLGFFGMVEYTALCYTRAVGLERDEEFARLYNFLRRRPGGTDENPLFSYLQAAARLYMSIQDVSPAEFEAVFNRLTRSAKSYAENGASTNYIRFLERALEPQ
jgi:hypothetical protein